MAFGVFAVKSGAGLSYAMVVKETAWQKARLFLTYQLGYVLLFCITAFVVSKIDMASYSELFQNWLKSGMTIHFILASLMASWGLYLLSHSHQNDICTVSSCLPYTPKSRAWLILALPCPVCISVIVFSLAIAKTLYSDRFLGLSWLILAVFVTLNTLTTFSLLLLQRLKAIKPEYLLGKMMIAVAAYFLLTVMVSPAFSEMESVYKIASSTASVVDKKRDMGLDINSTNTAVSLSLLLLAFVSGFWKRFYVTWREHD